MVLKLNAILKEKNVGFHRKLFEKVMNYYLQLVE